MRNQEPKEVQQLCKIIEEAANSMASRIHAEVVTQGFSDISPERFRELLGNPKVNSESGASALIPKEFDPVHKPKHYNSHPSGIECIDITRHMSFNIGNAIKYLWRADLKDAPIQDLEKAVWYIQDEIRKRKDVQE